MGSSKNKRKLKSSFIMRPCKLIALLFIFKTNFLILQKCSYSAEKKNITEKKRVVPRSFSFPKKELTK
jgi:hypothetical protein